jgi:hypothetical protein
MVKNSSVLFTGKIYDRLKFLVQIVLPALATLYFTLGVLWGLPEVEKVMATLTAIATFLGVLLGLSSSSYDKSLSKYDGMITVNNDPDQVPFDIETFGDPKKALEEKKELRLMIKPPELD